MRLRPLLLMAVVIGLVAPAAVADNHDGKDAAQPGRGPNHPGSERGGPARPGIAPMPGPNGGRGGHPYEGRFYNYGGQRDGVFFWPYPYPWPYGGYYSNYGNPYAYPYPLPYAYQQYYPNDDSMGGMPSTRGLVVPGDLPIGSTASWYYCDSPDGFYPYVKSCGRNWTPIPLAPPPPGASPPLSLSLIHI